MSSKGSKQHQKTRPIEITEGYQPDPTRGYQPSGQGQAQNPKPPKGGSAVHRPSKKGQQGG